MEKILKNPIHFLNKLFRKPNWYNLRSKKPISRVFGLDRGQPIDRYYVEKFLYENRHLIRGNVLEVAEDTYTKKFGTDVSNHEVLHVTPNNPKATIIGDLTKPETLFKEHFDCFICTQTLNFIYEVNKAIKGIHYLLKSNGVVLATVLGISQISRYDMDRWGEYWRFTTLSAFKSFEEVFGEENVKIDFYGSVLSAIAFLEGLSSDELTKEELEYKDQDYQLLITIIAEKVLM